MPLAWWQLYLSYYDGNLVNLHLYVRWRWVNVSVKALGTSQHNCASSEYKVMLLVEIAETKVMVTVAKNSCGKRIT